MRSPRTASTTSARLRGPPSLAKNDTKCTSPRPPRAHVEILPNTLSFQQFQDAMSIKHMKTYDFFKKKLKIHPRAPQKCDQLLCLSRVYHMSHIPHGLYTTSSSSYPCASVVATVVRTPRSEVSQRHRAGSWVWVMAKSRLEIW